MKGYRMNILEYTACTDAEARYDFESHIFENVWYEFVKHLPTPEDHENDTINAIDVWYSEVSDEIMCRTEELAEMIANILDGISGEHEAHTGYYDPEIDEEDDCVDDRTGWWAVDYD